MGDDKQNRNDADHQGGAVMPIHYRVRGTDLTKRLEVVFKSGHLKEAFDELQKQQSFEGWVKAAEEWARDTLVGAGHPGEVLGIEKVLVKIAHAAAEDSDEDFAARILRLIIKARDAIKRGRAESAAITGVKLGEAIAFQMVSEARNRRENKGGRPSNGSQRNILMAREFLRRRPSSKLSDTALKAKIGADQLFMASTKAQTLGQSASVAAIDAGIKKLSGKVS